MKEFEDSAPVATRKPGTNSKPKYTIACNMVAMWVETTVGRELFTDTWTAAKVYGIKENSLPIPGTFGNMTDCSELPLMTYRRLGHP